ncbi:DICT sensory domain-containing protein [Halopelagius longus]|uniref:DICT domain-containing protein n=1 Tax=Halopelagius longus TaxID=1236180 RepID=A0A1H1AVG6_9EURY|nr:DICT sensory domain-containing protein [Halopelagius longus]RDI70515.1 histidine kinase [Halopelagius longus]SDQ43136.1 DICT domain-containing protein [Halopelagius longus]
MSLLELVEDVEARRKTLYVDADDRSAVESVRERFSDRNVTVVAASSEPDLPEYAMLTDGDDVLAATALSELRPADEVRTPGFEAEPYRPILDELDETFFASYDTEQMLAASREIEDRAWRSGTGRLYAGFQRYSILEEQLRVYEQLGTKAELDVAALAAPDAELPSHESTFAVRPASSPEIRRVWFVAFDGGPRPDDGCALIAEERGPRRFSGFWTYDADTVEGLFEHVTDRYLDARGGSPSSARSDV